MTEYTLLKLEIGDATFTAHAPFSSASSGSDAESREDGNADGDSDDADGEGSDRRLLPVVVGLVFLVVVAVAVRKFRGNGEP